MESLTILNQLRKIMKAHSANIRLKSAIVNSIQITLTIMIQASNQVLERQWDQNLRKEQVEVVQRKRFRLRDLTTL